MDLDYSFELLAHPAAASWLGWGCPLIIGLHDTATGKPLEPPQWTLTISLMTTTMIRLLYHVGGHPVGIPIQTNLNCSGSSTDSEVESNGPRHGIKVRWPARFINAPDQLLVPRICIVCLLDPDEPTILGCNHMACTYHFNDNSFRIGPPQKFGGNWFMHELLAERPSDLPLTSIPLLRSLPHRWPRSLPRGRSALPGLHVQYPERFLGHGPVPLICVVCLRKPDDYCATVLGCGHLSCTKHLSFAPFLTGKPGYFPGRWPEESPPTSPLPSRYSLRQHPSLPGLLPKLGQRDTGELIHPPYSLDRR